MRCKPGPTALPGGEAAADGERRTVDEGALVAEQEGGEGGDVVFRAGPLGRDLPEEV
nr:hypothetical protein [Peterkaempfera griseoplana]